MKRGDSGEKERGAIPAIQNNVRGTKGSRNEKLFFLPSPPLSKKALTAQPLRIQVADANAKGVI